MQILRVNVPLGYVHTTYCQIALLAFSVLKKYALKIRHLNIPLGAVHTADFSTESTRILHQNLHVFRAEKKTCMKSARIPHKVCGIKLHVN